MIRTFEKVTYDDTGIIPTRADVGSAGYDFYTPEDITIKPHEQVIVKTNIKAKMDNRDVLLLFIRSSVGIKRNLMLSNCVGVIDSTYYNNPDNEGNIMFALYNYGSEEQFIKAGERVAQGVITSYFVADDDQPLSQTRTGGIGSSGK